MIIYFMAVGYMGFTAYEIYMAWCQPVAFEKILVRCDRAIDEKHWLPTSLIFLMFLATIALFVHGWYQH